MRIASLVAAVVLSGCAARPIDLTVAPASVELKLWCARFPDAACRNQAADTARARCSAIGRRARFVLSALLQHTHTHGQEAYFLYDCVR